MIPSENTNKILLLLRREKNMASAANPDLKFLRMTLNFCLELLSLSPRFEDYRQISHMVYAVGSETKSYYGSQAGLKLTIPLPQSP